MGIELRVAAVIYNRGCKLINYSRSYLTFVEIKIINYASGHVYMTKGCGLRCIRKFHYFSKNRQILKSYPILNGTFFQTAWQEKNGGSINLQVGTPNPVILDSNCSLYKLNDR